MVVGAKITSAFGKQWAFTCPVLYKFLNCNISIKRTKEFMKLDSVLGLRLEDLYISDF